jgi:cell wall-associated NlpC family hydrolase
MTEPLIVDTNQLNAASIILGKAAGTIPVELPKLSVPGTDPLSLAVAHGAARIEAPMSDLPGIKAKANTIAQNIDVAAKKYEETDRTQAEKAKQQFPGRGARRFGPDDTPAAPPPEQPTPHHTETVPGPGPDDQPYPNGAQPTMIDGAKPVPLRDDPPGFPAIPAGPQREQNWRDYLNGVGPDGSRLVSPGTAPSALPNPEAVRDPGLRALGAAGRQQGVSYAWGANQSTSGPTPGTLLDDTSGDAAAFGDNARTGFDCGGLVRYSMAQTTGNDPFVGRRDGNYAGTDRLDASAHLTPVKGGLFGAAVSQYAQPGDVLVFGESGHQAFSGADTHHTGLYVGNGVIINAPVSGSPVRLDPLTKWANDPTDILRAK